MKLDLREAGTEDAVTLLAFMRQFNASQGYPFEEHSARNAVLELLESASLGRVWLIVADGSAVGYLVLTFGIVPSRTYGSTSLSGSQRSARRCGRVACAGHRPAATLPPRTSGRWATADVRSVRSTPAIMYQSAEHILAPHLDASERLLWSGQPRGGIRLRAQDAFLIPFSILWCGFAIFWEASVVWSGAPFFFMLWGVPFVLVGLYIVFGRFIVDARSRARTFYGVTSERILIVSGLFSQQTKSLQLGTLTDVSLTQRGDGSGTIAFGPAHPMSGFLPAGGWPGAGSYAPPSFDLIERAREVHDIIRNAQRDASANA